MIARAFIRRWHVVALRVDIADIFQQTFVDIFAKAGRIIGCEPNGANAFKRSLQIVAFFVCQAQIGVFGAFVDVLTVESVARIATLTLTTVRPGIVGALGIWRTVISRLTFVKIRTNKSRFRTLVVKSLVALASVVADNVGARCVGTAAVRFALALVDVPTLTLVVHEEILFAFARKTAFRVHTYRMVAMICGAVALPVAIALVDIETRCAVARSRS